MTQLREVEKDESRQFARTHIYWLCVWFGVAVAILLRRPDILTNPQFWAEDATHWFKDAYFLGGIVPFLDFYGGYSQLIPRTVAAFAVSVLQVKHVPLAFNLFALVVEVSAISLICNQQFRFIIRSDILRAMLCLVVATGQPGGEIVGTLTGVHWPLTLAAILLCMLSFSRWGVRLLVWLIIASICLSSPNCVFCAPLVLVAMLLRKGELGSKVIYVSAVALHMLLIRVIVGTAEVSLPTTWPLTLAVLDFWHASVLQAFFGYAGAYYIDYWSWNVGFALSVLILIGVVTLGVVVNNWTGRLVTLATLCVCTGMVTLAIAFRQNILFPFPSQQLLNFPFPNHLNYNHGRYLFFPYCFVLTLFFHVCDRILLWPTAFRNVVQLALAAVSFTAMFANRSFGPLPDLNWNKYAQRIEMGWAGNVPINPTAWGWYLEVPPQAGKPIPNDVDLSLSEQFTSKSTDHVQLRMVNVNGQILEGIFEHASSSLARNILVNRPYLNFFYGLDPRVYEKTDGVTFILVVEDTDSPPLEIFRARVNPRSREKDRTWRSGKVDLSRFLGKQVSLRLVTDAGKDSGFDWALWLDLHFSEN